MSSPEGVGGDDLNQNSQNEDAAALFAELDGEETTLLNVVETFDQAKNAFYQACSQYAEKPSDQHRADVSECATTMAHTFKNSIRQISKDEPNTETGVRTALSLIYDEDESRALIFRKLTKCEDFESFQSVEGENKDGEPSESLLDMYLEMASEMNSPEEIYDAIVDGFMLYLQEEVNHFAAHIIPQEEKPAEVPQPISMRRELLDVAKLAVGVASGVFIAGSMLRRKQR
ncbi:MAG TPA: hypothetical protein VG992_00250 [Candidatus Saccharimonadales bacterium]|nr:hypothetical protein [Candidatus Saccharimonadales bacterium]